MTVLTFKVSGGNLIRTDMNRLVSYTRNNAVAKFELNEEWANISPVVAQFRKMTSAVMTCLSKTACVLYHGRSLKERVLFMFPLWAGIL